MLPDIVVVSRTLEPVAPEAVAALEADLGLAMPADYAELVTTYGAGTFCDELNVFDPARVRERTDEARERWAEYWFWDEDVVARSEMRRAVAVADSANGDELVLVPERGLVVLPRDEDDARAVGSSYVGAVTWFCTSGKLVAPSGRLWFQSWAEESCYENWSGGDFDQARAAVVAGAGTDVVEDRRSGQPATTFLVPRMGGHLYLAELDGPTPLYAHLRYLPDLADAADRLAEGLASAGVTRQSRWGAERS